ncbi:hypothetical protein QFC20_000087 [Naganishia adeliensis]|uniref:Uncharacterized protein n=1 Tax=Naganishia adeliensis TaxID=92952 RepID=A0ACC2X3D0_9TREE|nr:hypothetical protein QFC20_000087 [Naganishia adeliensis]
MSDGAHPHLNRNQLFDLHSMTAVVTGGGTGIGLMITLALVENGCKVFITSRDISKLEDVVKRYSGDGTERGEIIPIEVDITSKDSLAKAMQNIETQAPKGIQVLVNNAGIAGEGSREGYESIDMKDPDAISAQLWKSEMSEWDAILRTNVTSQYFTAAAFLPLLAKGKDLFKGYASQIINVTSISGVMKKASGGQYAYAASKAAMFQVRMAGVQSFFKFRRLTSRYRGTHQFTKVLATELQTSAALLSVVLSANLPFPARKMIAPGVFPSQMTAGSKQEDQKSSLAGTGKGESNPAGRPGDEKDMAGTVVFLASRAGV